MIDTLSRLFVVLLATAVAAALGFVFLRENFVYNFLREDAPPSELPRTEVRQLPAFGDDPALTVWVTQPEPGQPVVVYFMGEAGVLSVHEPQLAAFADAGFGIAAMAYRGGGGQAGRPSEAALYRDAQRVYAGLDTLIGRHVPESERVIYGFSFGTGLAARLAADQPELALILEAPYTRLCDSSIGFGTLVPGCLLLAGNEYDTLSRIGRIEAPLLVLHGQQDRFVPAALGEAVFAAAAEPRYLELYPDGGHDDLDRHGAWDDAISFVRVLRGAR